MTSDALVLVADDDRNLRSTASAILRGEGYAVVEAGDGNEALAMLLQHPVAVLVLDVRMSRRDGFAVLDELGSPPPMVLLASAYEFSGSDRARAGAKVFRYLRKPVPPASLITAVADAVAAGRQ